MGKCGRHASLHDNRFVSMEMSLWYTCVVRSVFSLGIVGASSNIGAFIPGNSVVVD